MIVVYSDERERFECITSYFERNLPKAERWRWDTAVKRWWAPSEDIARRLASYAQGAASLRLASLTEDERASLAASTASDSDFMPPAPPGLDYLPYQRAGIAYALRRFGDLDRIPRSSRMESPPRSPRLGEEGGFSPSRGGVLIADEMG